MAYDLSYMIYRTYIWIDTGLLLIPLYCSMQPFGRVLHLPDRTTVEPRYKDVGEILRIFLG
jgi:hypothetical protein